MPTPPPPPVKDPKDSEELLRRLGAIQLVTNIFRRLDGYAYGTRSHMPSGVDWTDFTNALSKVSEFCKARPDWTLEIVSNILGERFFGDSLELTSEAAEKAQKDFALSQRPDRVSELTKKLQVAEQQIKVLEGTLARLHDLTHRQDNGAGS